MNTPHLTPVVPVDTIWHTNWGFCIRTILSGQMTDFFLDQRIAGSHRAYVERFTQGERREHADVFEKHGTPQTALPWTIATLKARIIATQDDIPLDPEAACLTIQKLWDTRIQRAKIEDRPALEAQRDELCRQITRVIQGELSSVVAIEGILGVCDALKFDI